jgi:hypothetical protein
LSFINFSPWQEFPTGPLFFALIHLSPRPLCFSRQLIFTPGPLFSFLSIFQLFFTFFAWATFFHPGHDFAGSGLGWVEDFFGPGAGPHMGRKSGPDAQLLPIPGLTGGRKKSRKRENSGFTFLCEVRSLRTELNSYTLDSC